MKRTIAWLLAGLMLAALLPVGVFGAPLSVERRLVEFQDGRGRDGLRLWYASPAAADASGTPIYPGEEWIDNGLPLGNGYMGALVGGEMQAERIQFNEKTLWTGGPGPGRSGYQGGNLPGRSGTLEQVRQDLLAGDPDAAAKVARSGLTGVKTDAGFGALQNFGVLEIDHKFNGQTFEPLTVSQYMRDLELSTATASTSFAYQGVGYMRQYFTSWPDRVMAIRHTATEKGSLTMSVGLAAAQEGAMVTAEGGVVTLTGALEDNGLRYAAGLRVIAEGGQVEARNGKIEITAADTVVLLLTAATDYADSYPDYRSEEDPAQTVADLLKAAGETGYEALLQRHLEDYEPLFGRVSLELGEAATGQAANALLKSYREGNMTRELEVLLYQYGRYLTLASSRQGSLPAGAQGVWSATNAPAWSGAYRLDGGLERNYAAAYTANLAESALPLLQFAQSLLAPGRETAKEYAGIGDGAEAGAGFVFGANANPFGWTSPGGSFDEGWRPAAAAQLMHAVWEYCAFTGDLATLRNDVYPMMKELAGFWQAFLSESEDGALYVTPGAAPDGGAVVLATIHDQVAVKQFLRDVIDAAALLGIDSAQRAQWQALYDQMPGEATLESGLIGEWYGEAGGEDPQAASTPAARLERLAGLYPGSSIGQDNEELLAAARATLDAGGGDAAELARRAAMWARALDGERAYSLLRAQTAYLHTNLLCGAPYALEYSTGFTAAANEMLLQSQHGYLQPLPALSLTWANGSVSGLMARGGFEVDMKWSDEYLDEMAILSTAGGECAVRYGNLAGGFTLTGPGGAVRYTTDPDGTVRFDTVQGTRYVLAPTGDKPIGTPTGVEAVVNGKTSAKVTWYPVGGEGVGYDVYRSEGDGPLQPITTEPVTDTTYVDENAPLDAAVYYAVMAVRGGNVSEISEAVRLKKLAAGIVDDRDPRIEYTGQWSDIVDVAHQYNTLRTIEDSAPGDSIRMVFVGTGVRLLMPTGPDFTFVEVYIDDQLMEKVSLYSGEYAAQQPVYQIDGMTYGEHTVAVISSGEVQQKAAKAQLEFDAFEVLDDTFVPVEKLTIQTITGAAAVTTGGKIRVETMLEPGNADRQDLNWLVTDVAGNETELATVDGTGLVTAGSAEGLVRVTAATRDGSGVTAYIDLKIVNGDEGRSTLQRALTAAETPAANEPSYMQDADYRTFIRRMEAAAEAMGNSELTEAAAERTAKALEDAQKELSAALTISGKVTGRGVAVAGAEVYLVTPGDTADEPLQNVQTDANGQYILFQVRPGEYEVHVDPGMDYLLHKRSVKVEEKQVRENVELTYIRALREEREKVMVMISSRQLNDGNYTQESWDKLDKAMKLALVLLNDLNTVQGEVESALADLRTALEGLVLDRTMLDDAITEAEAMERQDYTAASWEHLQSTISRAKAGNNAALGLENMLALMKLLREAEDNLVNLRGLRQPLEEWRTAQNTGDYSDESWVALQQALNHAATVLETAASQAEVNAERLALEQAVAALGADKSALAALYRSHETDANDDQFEPERWAAFETARSAAASVLDDREATQRQVDTAAAGLSAGVKGLTMDTAALWDAYSALAMEKNEGRYSADSWEALEIALAKAGEALSTAAGQSQLDTALEELETARDGLSMDKAALRRAVERWRKEQNGGRYSAAAWSALQQALEQAEEALETAELQSGLDEAQTALSEAGKALAPDREPLQTLYESWKNRLNRAEPEPQEADDGDDDEAEKDAADTSDKDETDKTDETDNSEAEKDKAEEGNSASSGATGSGQNQSGETSRDTTPQGPLYPEDRWEVLQQRLAETAVVLEGKTAGQTELDTAFIGLRGAVTGLTLDTKALTELCLSYAGQENGGQYSVASWATFEEAYMAALETLAAATEQETLDAAAQALKEAGEGLGLDKSALEAKIGEAAAMENGGRYSEASWQNWQQAISKARQTLNRAETQTELDEAPAELDRAAERLSANEGGLLTLANKWAGEENNGRYSAASWAALQQALAEAQAALGSGLPQSGLDQVEVALRDAELGLGLDTEALEATIQLWRETERGDYVAARWEALQNALSSAQSVQQTAQRQAEVDRALLALQAAGTGLRLEVTGLEEVYNQYAGQQNDGRYSEESWGNLQTALEAAASAMAGTAGQDAVDSARQRLEEAGAALGVSQDALLALYEEYRLLANDGAYSEKSWQALQNAFSAAKAVMDRGGAQKEVDEAESALRQAFEGLARNDSSLKALHNKWAGQTNGGRYSATSWAALREAVAQAAEALGAAESQREIDAAAGALERAEKALVVDKASLGELYGDWKDARNDGRFSSDSWSALQAALENAGRALEGDQALQKDVDDALTGLTGAVDALDVDNRALEELYETYSALPNEGQYTEGSWQALQKALQAARSAMGPLGTQQAADAALEELEKAAKALEVETEALQALYTAHRSAHGAENEDRYTAASWQALQAALDETASLLAQEAPGKAAVGAAYNRLWFAWHGLRADTTALEELITRANGLTAADYAPESWEELRSQVDAVTTAMEGDVTPDVVQAAVRALQLALDGLIPVGNADTGYLAAKIHEVENAMDTGELDKEDYTPSSWLALSEALEAARKLQDVGGAEQRELDEALTALNNAVERLEAPGTGAELDTGPLLAAMDRAMALDPAAYERESWNHMQTYLEAGKTELARDTVRQYALDTVTSWLEDSIENLEPRQGGRAVVKTALAAAVVECKGLMNQQPLYLPDSWLEFEEALLSAAAIMDNASAGQDEVDACLATLSQKKAALAKVEAENYNRAQLQSLYNLGQQRTYAEEYDEQAWLLYRSLLTQASAALEDPTAPQEELAAVLRSLRGAEAALLPAGEGEDAPGQPSEEKLSWDQQIVRAVNEGAVEVWVVVISILALAAIMLGALVWRDRKEIAYGLASTGASIAKTWNGAWSRLGAASGTEPPVKEAGYKPPPFVWEPPPLPPPLPRGVFDRLDGPEGRRILERMRPAEPEPSKMEASTATVISKPPDKKPIPSAVQKTGSDPVTATKTQEAVVASAATAGEAPRQPSVPPEKVEDIGQPIAPTASLSAAPAKKAKREKRRAVRTSKEMSGTPEKADRLAKPEEAEAAKDAPKPEKPRPSYFQRLDKLPPS